MTTLAWLGASLVSLWMAVEFFDTYSNTYIGLALLCLFFVCAGLTVRNAFIDADAVFGKGDSDDG